jgi:hypothetical protein
MITVYTGNLKCVYNGQCLYMGILDATGQLNFLYQIFTVTLITDSGFISITREDHSKPLFLIVIKCTPHAIYIKPYPGKYCSPLPFTHLLIDAISLAAFIAAY